MRQMLKLSSEVTNQVKYLDEWFWQTKILPCDIFYQHHQDFREFRSYWNKSYFRHKKGCYGISWTYVPIDFDRLMIVFRLKGIGLSRKTALYFLENLKLVSASVYKPSLFSAIPDKFKQTPINLSWVEQWWVSLNAKIKRGSFIEGTNIAEINNRYFVVLRCGVLPDFKKRIQKYLGKYIVNFQGSGEKLKVYLSPDFPNPEELQVIPV